MCQITHNHNYQNYSNLNFSIKNELNTDLFKKFKSKLDSGEVTLVDLRSENIPFWLYNELYAYVLDKLKFKNNITNKTLDSTKSNLHNYSIAKTYNFINEVKKVLSDSSNNKDGVLDVANVFFNSQQSTEDHQVEKITQTASDIADGNYLEYFSRKDGRVRDEHRRADGVILPANDSWWSVGQNLLSDWNCRCSIIRSSSKTPQLTHSQATIKPIDKKPNSTIDLKSEKVIVFNQHLSIFDIPTVIKRKQFKANGF